jgi:DNA repair photolyase
VTPRGVHSLFVDLGCGMWSVTPYALCDYRCVYCCTGVQGSSKPILDRTGAIAEVRRRLDPSEPPIVLIGALCDAYPPVEREHAITRGIVETLVEARQPFTIITKGDVVLRDLDLLRAHGDLAYVQVSISSTDEEALRHLDPGAPPGHVRFEIIDELHRSGVPVGLNALPWIPDVSDTANLIARVPSDVEVVFSPLSFGPDRSSMRLLGRPFSRPEVWRRYLEEYRRFGDVPNTSWVRPSPPPEENHPLRRLPKLVAVPS